MLTINRVEIVAVARSWLGTPWIHQGRLKDIGVDCGGLIISLGKELGHPMRAARILALSCGLRARF